MQEEAPRVRSTPDERDLPHFGCAGRSSPDDWMEFRSSERTPKLSIPNGEAWERNMTLITWVKEVVLVATSVSIPFSDFVSKAIVLVKTRYAYQKG